MAGMSGENGGWTGGGHGIGGGEPGRDPGNNGGGGNGNSGNSSNSGIGQSSQEKEANNTSQGRRDKASKSFNGLVGLAESAAVGLGLKDRGKSELGKLGWSGPGHESREAAANLGRKEGAEMAATMSGINTVGNLATNTGKLGLGLNLGIKGFEKSAVKGMTEDQERGFKDVQSQKTGLANVGTAVAGYLGGPIGSMAAKFGFSIADHARQASYAQDQYGVNISQGRRDTASKSFSGSSGNGRPTGLIFGSSPNIGWQPSSVGFGDYNSHLEGLLS